jgi:hypothetical protein
LGFPVYGEAKANVVEYFLKIFVEAAAELIDESSL